ncbi:MAG: GtrA family protein [Candidatus Saccharibacteria bacterium]
MVNKWANNLREFILLIIDTCYIPFHRLIPIQTFRYAATGGFNTLLDISLYFICYNFILDKQVVDMGIVSISPHIFAFLMVFPITFLTGFLLAKYITFSASEIRGRTQFMRYILSVCGSIFLNYVFLKIFVEFVGLWPTLAKIITTIIVVIYSYFVQKFYTFKITRSLAL